MSRLLSGTRSARGQALVETALASIVFLLLALGTVEAGRAVWNYNTLAQAAREGARYAIVHGGTSSDPSGPGSAHFTEPDQDAMVTAVVVKHASGLSEDRLTVSSDWTGGSNARGSKVKVTASYGFEPIFGFIGGPTITLRSSTTMIILH